MRLVIDLQGAQTGSRWRGIGRYTLALALTIAKNSSEHEIIIVLNDAFPETVLPLRRAFEALLPTDNIRVWSAPCSLVGADREITKRRHFAEALYESFLVSLEPDVILISSLFEGLDDGFVATVKATDFNIPTAVICYDFIPLHDPDRYLSTNRFWHDLYMERFEALGRADLLLAISDYTAREADERLPKARRDIANISAACSEMFQPSTMPLAERVSLRARVSIDRAFIMTSGGVDPHKNLRTLFQAFATLPAETRSAHQIVLAGNTNEDHRRELLRQAGDAGMRSGELIFTGFISDDELVALYTDAALLVFPSLDEGFGLPPLEAMSCGTPAIGSNVSSIPEVIGLDAALFDPYDAAALAELMQRSLSDEIFRAELLENAQRQANCFSWDATAGKALKALEALHAQSSRVNAYTRDDVVACCLDALAEQAPELVEVDMLARHLAYDFPPQDRQRRLFVDISTLRVHDARTGCQRVARSILMEWLQNPPTGVDVCPVYANGDTATFFHAHTYTAELTQQPTQLEDLPIDYAQGDVFFGLDLHADIGDLQVLFLQKMRRRGVRVLFLVYDLLPLEMPDNFIKPIREAFKHWVRTITTFDGLIGISHASSNAVYNWERANQPAKMDEAFEYHAVHLGADIENSMPTLGMPKDAGKTLEAIETSPSFLMAGTLEPRKGQLHALDAFEALWAADQDVTLIIVGKEGWHVEELAARLRNHPERDKRLFWLEGASDEYLEAIYGKATCLLAASWGEGFGLPLIEAARYDLPILARDLLVFREVAKEHATYFDTVTADGLAQAVVEWKAAFEAGTIPSSANMPRLTWAESADQMAKVLLQPLLEGDKTRAVVV